MLQVGAVHVGYGAIRALRGVSLEVNAGEVVALIGANGAGKSTLLRTISGILTPSSGEVRFEGRTLNGLAEDKIVRLGILQVQEGRGILTRMTVQENLEMGAYARSGKAEIRRTWRWCSRSSRSCASAGSSSGPRSAAASSRCSRSAGP